MKPTNRSTLPVRRTSAALLVLLAACGDRQSEPSPETLEARRNALRAACVSNELARRAEDELQTLQSLGGAQPDGGAAQSPANAAVTFARASAQHAQLQMAAFAQVDSSLNHSPTPQDSARHATAARSFQIRTPEAGTVEANVIADYERKFSALISDPDHPCNWQDEIREKE